MNHCRKMIVGLSFSACAGARLLVELAGDLAVVLVGCLERGPRAAH